MSDGKTGLFPETHFGSVAREIYWDVANRLGGKASQVKAVARIMGVEPDLALRARKGRIGARAFPKWWEAYRKWDADQREIAKLEWRDLDKRLRALEQRIDRGDTQTASEDSHSDFRSGLGTACFAAAPS